MPLLWRWWWRSIAFRVCFFVFLETCSFVSHASQRNHEQLSSPHHHIANCGPPGTSSSHASHRCCGPGSALCGSKLRCKLSTSTDNSPSILFWPLVLVLVLVLVVPPSSIPPGTVRTTVLISAVPSFRLNSSLSEEPPKSANKCRRNELCETTAISRSGLLANHCKSLTARAMHAGARSRSLAQTKSSSVGKPCDSQSITSAVASNKGPTSATTAVMLLLLSQVYNPVRSLHKSCTINGGAFRSTPPPKSKCAVCNARVSGETTTSSGCTNPPPGLPSVYCCCCSCSPLCSPFARASAHCFTPFRFNFASWKAHAPGVV